MVIRGTRQVLEIVDVDVTDKEIFEAAYRAFGLRKDMVYLEKDDKKVLQPVTEGIYEYTDHSTHGSPYFVPSLVTTDKTLIKALRLLNELEDLYHENMIAIVGGRKDG